MKILYVEDNAVNLSLIERIAQMNNHDLVSYEEAETALEALDKGLTVDLILLDIQLAGEMDGIDFAKAVRAKGWTQPIIAITAYAMIGDKERIIAAGCNEYLPKPLPIAEFLTLLAKYDPTASSTLPPKKATQESPALAAAIQTQESPAVSASTEQEEATVPSAATLAEAAQSTAEESKPAPDATTNDVAPPTVSEEKPADPPSQPRPLSEVLTASESTEATPPESEPVPVVPSSVPPPTDKEQS